MEGDKSTPKKLPPPWSDLFRLRDADFLSDIPSFAESARISYSERDCRTAFSSDPFAAESIPLFIAHPSFGQYDFLTPLMLTFI
ncbi:hypothetical protein HQ49_09085 [Porphyromonas gulae]|nr:hypothetical protein HQ49_09085 [Porphyromonas gulae]